MRDESDVEMLMEELEGGVKSFNNDVIRLMNNKSGKVASKEVVRDMERTLEIREMAVKDFVENKWKIKC